MNRREFVKGILAFAAIASLPITLQEKAERELYIKLPFEVPVGYIFQHNINGKVEYIISTDKGPKIVEGGRLSKSDYPELYAAIAESYGETTETFELPDLRGTLL